MIIVAIYISKAEENVYGDESDKARMEKWDFEDKMGWDDSRSVVIPIAITANVFLALNVISPLLVILCDACCRLDDAPKTIFYTAIHCPALLLLLITGSIAIAVCDDGANEADYCAERAVELEKRRKFGILDEP